MRQILVILLVFFIISSVNGQEDKKWNFQLNFGTTITIPYVKSEENNFVFNGQIVNTERINYSSGFGYFAEFITSYNFNSKLALMFGANYSNLSFNINSELELQTNKGTITTSNIHLPLLAKYKLIEKIPISISFGPYLRILTSANEKGTIYLDTTGMNIADPNDPLLRPETDYTNDIKENYKKYDYGLSLQLDYEITISNKFKGVIITRFNYGLRNVIEHHSSNINIPNEWNNYNFDIGIGIKI